MRLWLLFVLVGVACGSSCDCACDYRELGRGTWMLLHEMVEREPSERLEASFVSLMWSLSDLYPCEECRGHLAEYLYNHPPEMSKSGCVVCTMMSIVGLVKKNNLVGIYKATGV